MNLDIANIRYYSLGRHALVAGLKMLGIGGGHRVLMPEFVCRDLLASVNVIGAKPVFYPVGRDLQPSSNQRDWPDATAVIAINYFGFAQPLEPFQEYCTRAKAVLIEDNAHGFLSCDERNRLLGSRGILGIFSLRKTFALADGAMLVANNEEWKTRLPAPQPCRDGPLPKSFVLKQGLRRIQKMTGIRVKNLAEQLTRCVRKIRTGHALPISSMMSEFEMPVESAMHCASLRAFNRHDAVGEAMRRCSLYQDFHRNLHHLKIEPVFGDLPLGVVPYGYPFRASDADAAMVRRIARKKGFDCFLWPDLPTAIVDSAPDYYRNVWWVNFL